MGIDFEFYENNIITNSGTGEVEDFAKALENNLEDVKKAIENSEGKFTVFAGYHGDASGGFAAKFTAEEMAAVYEMHQKMKDETGEEIELECVDSSVSEQKIITYLKAGCVFFTWCFSDKRVRSIAEDNDISLT